MKPSRTSSGLLKPLVFALCLVPLALLTLEALGGGLGANPIETITHTTGDWTLRLLLVTLTVTPLRELSGWSWPVRLRRMLGLFAFFYGCLHLMTYVWFDKFFMWGEMAHDIVKRPFITVGMAAFVLLVPLAATSTNAMMRRLGRRWKPLHRMVYTIGILGVVHYLWLVKADIRQPLIYGALLALLLGYRLWRRWARRRAAGAPGTAQGRSARLPHRPAPSRTM